MSIESQLTIPTPKPIEWLHSNVSIITAKMQDLRQYKLDLADAASTQESQHRFDDQRLILSEMELCEVTLLLDLPQGFRPISAMDGRVTVLPWGIDEATLPEDLPIKDWYLEGHAYAYNSETDFVICLTAGQWDLLSIFNGKTKPGERMQAMQRKAPSLIHKLSDQVYALCGTSEEIADQLALGYTIF